MTGMVEADQVLETINQFSPFGITVLALLVALAALVVVWKALSVAHRNKKE